MAVIAKDAGAASSGIAVAVSQTSDPQGTWNYYSVTVGNQGVWVDFPTLGFNKDWNRRPGERDRQQRVLRQQPRLGF